MLSPLPFDLGGNREVSWNNDYRLLSALTDSLWAHGCHAINLWGDLDKVISKSNYLTYGYKHDGHFTAEGYRLMAEAIFKQTQGLWK